MACATTTNRHLKAALISTPSVTTIVLIIDPLAVGLGQRFVGIAGNQGAGKQ